MAYVFNNENLDFIKKVQEYEKIIQYNFNVSNSNLLKTGFFGSLINLMAFTSVDVKQYYLKLFQEFHPALASDFNSMLFHASFYNVNVSFATPATFNVYFEVPKIRIDNGYYIYNITKNTQFTDKNGFNFTIPDDIEITILKDSIEANRYSEEGKTKLNAFLTTTTTGQEVFLVEYNNLKQKKIDFKKIIVPDYDYGTSFSFDINIDDYSKISKISVWVNEDPNNPIDINLIQKMNDEEITKSFNITPMNIKYYKFGSSKFDYDIFLNIQKTLITFSLGNGIYGKKIDSGSEIIIKIELSEGEQGNLQYIEFSVPDVYVRQIDLNKNETYFTTILNGFSIEAGYGGTSVEDSTAIRNKIFDQIQLRNSIITERDFEIAFRKNEAYPFIDAKFIDNKSIIFIFDALKYNNKVIETTSLNLTEDQIANNPFYPEINYNGKTLISPFYFKRENNNVTRAYMVNNDIEIPLFTSASTDPLIRLNNSIKLYVRYDFTVNKSYIVLENTIDDYVYKVKTNQFEIELNYGNGFKWEVDQIYTDSFCIIKNYLYDFEIKVFDNQGNLVITWFNYYSENSKYHQLKPIQDFYKFYIQIPPVNYDFTTTTVVLDYLEDQLADIIGTIEELYQPLEQGELPYLLRVPFIDKDFYNSIDYNEMYSILTNHFQVIENEDKLAITSKVQQAFYNTIDLNPDYLPIIFETTNIAYSSPKIPVICNLVINKNYLALSTYDQYTLEFNIKLDIANILLQKEGFQVEFYESEVEKYILDKYNQDFELIKNIELKSPQKFIIKNSDEIYNEIVATYSIENAINFVPPYFYFDIDNIQINTILK